jgi:AcrR family transcriptional regulator
MEPTRVQATPPPQAETCSRHEEILEAATSLFAEYGYSDAVTQLLADKLGVGKGTIYRYFPSKQALFFAAADRAMVRLHAWIESRVRQSDDPIEQIRLGVHAYLDFFAEHPEFVELLIQERAEFPDRAQPTYFEHREVAVTRWRERYRRLIAEGRIRPMLPETLSDVLTAVVYGSMFLNHMSRQTGTFKNSADDILDVIFFGILSPSERERLSHPGR